MANRPNAMATMLTTLPRMPAAAAAWVAMANDPILRANVTYQGRVVTATCDVSPNRPATISYHNIPILSSWLQAQEGRAVHAFGLDQDLNAAEAGRV